MEIYPVIPQDLHTSASPTFAGGIFTGVVTGTTPTAGVHFATKEYVDLALGVFKTFFLSDTGSGVGSLNYVYPHETTAGQSTIVNDGEDEEYGTGTHLHKGFITEVGEPGTTTIHEGVISFHFHAKKGNSNQRTTTLHAILSRVDADGTTGKVEIVETEISGELTDTELAFDIHAVVSADVEIASTTRLILEVYANVSGVTQEVVVTLYMEGTEDSYFTTKVDSGIWQNHGDVLDDLNTVGQVGGDNQVLIGTGVNVLAWESGNTLRTSIGLGTGDSPMFAGLTITGNSVFGLNSSVFRPAAGGDSTTFFQVLDADGGTPILNIDSTNERVGIGTDTPLRKLDVYGGAFSVGGLNDGLFLSYGGSGGVIVGMDHAQEGYNDVTIRAGVDGTGIIIKTDGKVGIGITTPKTLFTIEGILTLKEQASADGDTEAYGQVWVKNDTPNTLWFTDDEGNDFQLSGIATEVLDASLVWNPPEIANNANTGINITVTGAELGDFVLVSFSLNLVGISLTGYVSEADTVLIILCNSTGEPVDLAEGTFYIRVLKK